MPFGPCTPSPATTAGLDGALGMRNLTAPMPSPAIAPAATVARSKVALRIYFVAATFWPTPISLTSTCTLRILPVNALSHGL